MYFREEQAEDDVLVLGSVDLTAQGVGRLPEDFSVVQVGGGYVIVGHAGFSPLLFGGQAPGHSGRYMYHGNCSILTELRHRHTPFAHSCHSQWWLELIADPCLVGSSPPADR